jgi:hypothetical protein
MIVEAALFAILLVAVAGGTRIFLAARQERRRRELSGPGPLFFIRHQPPELGLEGRETGAAAKNLENSA